MIGGNLGLGLGRRGERAIAGLSGRDWTEMQLRTEERILGERENVLSATSEVFDPLLEDDAPDLVGKTLSSSNNFCNQLMTKSMYVGAGSETIRWF